MVKRSDYTALVSAVETFMSLISVEKSEAVPVLEKFCSTYSWIEWNNRFRVVFSVEPSKYAVFFAEIRNVVTHPKARKAKIKYADIAFSNIKLHKLYMFLFILFIKAVLLYNGSISLADLESFLIKLLDSRAGVYPIE